MKPMTTFHKKSLGFTLVELLTVLTVLAFTLALSAPSLAEFNRNTVLTNTVNTLVSNIYRTRSEAMKSGRLAFMIPDGANHTDWKDGWLIAIDSNNNKKYDEGTDDVIYRYPEKVPEYLDIFRGASDGQDQGPKVKLADDTKVPAIIFNGAGFSRTLSGGFGAMTMSVRRNDPELTGARKLNATRRIILAETGRLRTCRPTSDSDSKCLEASNT